MTLNFASFRTALDRLDKAMHEAQLNPQNDVIRDGAIQRFEYSYELSWKSLKRYLELYAPEGKTIESFPFSDLIRLGFERGLLKSSFDVWRDFRTAREATSHIYDGQKALEVFSVIPRFVPEARHLLNALERAMNAAS